MQRLLKTISLCHWFVLLAIFGKHSILSSHGQSLVAAQQEGSYLNQRSSMVRNAYLLKSHGGAKNEFEMPSPISDLKIDMDDKSEHNNNAKTIEALLNAATKGDSSTSNDQEHVESKKTKKTKKKSAHEYDIVHDFDHLDNESYNDIVWYDGPHRDDEEEHSDDYHDDYHHDDIHHDDIHHDDIHHEEDYYHDDDHGEDLGENILDKGTAQIVMQQDHSEKNTPSSKVDHLMGFISTSEICQRLKNKCESDCYEFRSGMGHMSMSCEAASLPELLFWGRCCEIRREKKARSNH
ncbi:hypothetical protein BGZ76_010720 [Entomortierella beljakovae]|nr:hypothetical protein BGZ76_010720 [Entomortierella beljakovae]